MSPIPRLRLILLLILFVSILSAPVTSRAATASVTINSELQGSSQDYLDATFTYTWTGSNYIALMDIKCNAIYYPSSTGAQWDVYNNGDLTPGGGSKNALPIITHASIWSHGPGGSSSVAYYYTYHVVVQHRMTGAVVAEAWQQGPGLYSL